MRPTVTSLCLAALALALGAGTLPAWGAVADGSCEVHPDDAVARLLAAVDGAILSAAEVASLYAGLEAPKGGGLDPANLRAFDSCRRWRAVTLGPEEIGRLVPVYWTGPLAGHGGPLRDIAQEARARLVDGWPGGPSDAAWILGLLERLRAGEEILSEKPAILVHHTRVAGYPAGGSYYVQDGNHRLLAVALYLAEGGQVAPARFVLCDDFDNDRFFGRR